MPEQAEKEQVDMEGMTWEVLEETNREVQSFQTDWAAPRFMWNILTLCYWKPWPGCGGGCEGRGGLEWRMQQ